LVWITSLISIALTYVVSWLLIPSLGENSSLWWQLSTIISCGTLAGAIIPELVKVFTSTSSAHVKEVVTSSREGGASLNILSGLVAGNFSCLWLGLSIASLMAVAYWISTIGGNAGLGGLMVAEEVFAFGLVAFGFLGMGPVTIAVAPAHKSSNFDACLTLVLGAEGGFANDARDKGGATNFGITIGTLTDWRRGRSSDTTVTIDDVRALTLDEAKEIYRSRFWNVMRCDDLPPGVDLLVFDFGVNAGTARSARVLQQVLGVEQDGSVGPVTLNGLNTCPADKVIRDFSARRLDFYRSLDDFSVFGAGWTNRTNTMLEAALRMGASRA
jgi:hypothetical protein